LLWVFSLGFSVVQVSDVSAGFDGGGCCSAPTAAGVVPLSSTINPPSRNFRIVRVARIVVVCDFLIGGCGLCCQWRVVVLF